MASSVSVRWFKVDDTSWPVPVELEHRLRYDTGRRDLEAASVVAAYSALVDPAISQKQAIESLLRARKAAAFAAVVVLEGGVDDRS